jgi:hypothetical protein
MWSVPSAMEVRGKFTEGASRWMICAVSVSPVFSITSAVTTSTGTGDCVTVRLARRVPTATSSSIAMAAGASAKLRVAVCPAAIVTDCVEAAKPTRLTRIW